MRRSAQVAAPLLAAAALSLLTGCRPKPQMQRCVDEQNHVVPDSFCQNLPPANNSGMANGQVYVPYRFYYGGGGGYGIGSSVFGGGYLPASGSSYATSTGTTVRGGFGSSFGGGESGGE